MNLLLEKTTLTKLDRISRGGKLPSLLPADVEATVLFEQDVGDALAVTQQVVLDVSAPWFRADVLRDVSGETNLEVAQSTAGHKALQLLSG